MSVGVSHSFGGTVVVCDMESGRRWDLSPEMADVAVQQCTDMAGRACHSGMVVIDTLDDRQFRFMGRKEDLLKMAADLRDHAELARLMPSMEDTP